MAKEHPLKPFYSVLVLAFACSALVAAAAVGLRPLQEANRSLDMKKNVLLAAGIYEESRPVQAQFSDNVEGRVIELATGSFVPGDMIDPDSFDPLKAALSEESGVTLDREEDPAGIRRLEKHSLVYLVKDSGVVSQIVLPVRGKGLWSTIYAYVAIDRDLTTIRGISFYEHGETPGLGGEVENVGWQRGWQQKKIYTPEGNLGLNVVRSGTEIDPDVAEYRVDGLSGATITTQGIDRLVAFWFGDSGFKPFLDQIRGEGILDEGGFHE